MTWRVRGTGGKRRERKGSRREGTNYCKESRKMHTTSTLRLKGKPFFLVWFSSMEEGLRNPWWKVLTDVKHYRSEKWYCSECTRCCLPKACLEIRGLWIWKYFMLSEFVCDFLQLWCDTWVGLAGGWKRQVELIVETRCTKKKLGFCLWREKGMGLCPRSREYWWLKSQKKKL